MGTPQTGNARDRGATGAALPLARVTGGGQGAGFGHAKDVREGNVDGHEVVHRLRGHGGSTGELNLAAIKSKGLLNLCHGDVEGG